MPKQSAPAEHEHRWADLPVPGEPRGRVYQCADCKTCGHRRQRFGGSGKIVEFPCSAEGCKRPAKVRLFGRGSRGAFRWACADHAKGQRVASASEVVVEKRPSTPPPAG